MIIPSRGHFIQTFIHGAIPLQHSVHLVTIFGRSSKGLVGLELVGAGKAGRSLQEKIIYLTKKCGPPIPLRRFVICFDQWSDYRDGKKGESNRWLELPALILFWQLCGMLPIHQLDECVCAGMINVNGQIQVPSLSALQVPASLKLIGIPHQVGNAAQVGHIFSLFDLLANFSGVAIQQLG